MPKKRKRKNVDGGVNSTKGGDNAKNGKSKKVHGNPKKPKAVNAVGVVPFVPKAVLATAPKTRRPVLVVDSKPIIANVLSNYNMLTNEQNEAEEKEEAESKGDSGLEMKGRKKKKKGGVKAIFSEVEELGASSFTGKEKRDWEKKQLVKLGAKASKNQKMPFKMLRGMRKKQGEREEWQRELLLNMGLSVKKKAKKEKAMDTNGGMRSLASTTGRYNRGVLSLSKRDFKAVNKSGNTRAKPIHKLMNR